MSKLSEAELFINKLNACNEPVLTKEGTKHAIEIIENQLYEIERLNNIINEVKEYIERNTEEKKSWLNGIPDYRVFKGDTKDLLEILDKENK